MKLRKLIGAIAATVFLVSCFCLSPVSAENRNYNIKVMTQNMNPGPEIAAVAFAQNPMDAIAYIINGISESKIPDRAAMVAAEIARTNPDLIALQEAVRWEFTTELPGGGTVNTEVDQLYLLLRALNALGLHYRVAAVHELTSLDLQIISYTDRDAVLVRSDLPPDQLKVLGSEIHEYDTLAKFPVFDGFIQVLRGWISVDVKANGSRFTFVATHLEAPVPLPDPVTGLDIIPASIQVAQADQLMAELRKSDFPVILAGDFNSDAGHSDDNPGQYPPDSTDSYDHILAARFSDAWEELHPADTGFTWPLTMDLPASATLLERIDLVFTNGPKPISIERIGVDSIGGLFASDHAGVVAEFNLLRHQIWGGGRKHNNNFHAHRFDNSWRIYFHRLF